MKTQDMHIGMHVLHPDLGVGVVKRLAVGLAEIEFDGGVRELSPETSDLQPTQAEARLAGLTIPLETLIRQAVESTVDALELERPPEIVESLAIRWPGGKLVLHPNDPALQTKEVDLETFFHKIVMIRNNLRVLEQKVNASDKLTSVEKFDMHQYITRCYGSMTTFNVLFKRKEDQFNAKG